MPLPKKEQKQKDLVHVIQKTRTYVLELLVTIAILLVIAILLLITKVELYHVKERGDVQSLTRDVQRMQVSLSDLTRGQSGTAPTHATQTVKPGTVVHANDTSISPWGGLYFAYPWSVFTVVSSSPDALVIANNEGTDQVTIEKLPILEQLPSFVKTDYAGLVYKPKDVCDSYIPKGGDCSGAFYFYTSLNMYRIRSNFSGGDSTTLKELENSVGKSFYASLNESEL